ncbi:MAG: transglycosylase domain-containing protein, partial [Myxococcota bacterium]
MDNHKVTMAPAKKFLVCIAAASLAVVVYGLAALPGPLFSRPFSPVLLSREGVLLDARVAADGQWRFSCPDAVAGRYRAALVAGEDRRFRWHPGVDPFAVARALWQRLGNGGKRSGASTLTMQLMRMANGNPERTVADKLSEMAQAVGFELFHSKREIISLYACHAPMGGNVVGLEAASWLYFRRPPEEMSWAE